VLSDLRESGAIEQDADIVSFIYRPEYYGFLQDDDGNSNQGVGEIIVAKHRNGALDKVRLRFIGEFAKFDNMENYYDETSAPAAPTNLSANTGFDAPSFNSYTVPSKMNDENEDDGLDFGNNDDSTPF
jgi:replicative DNA helicase